MNPRSPLSDIVIAGAGIAGASLALALKQALGSAFSVTLADPALAQAQATTSSFRALAIAPDARGFLEGLAIWPALAAQSQPIRSMVITDSRPGALPNPAFLRFEGGMTGPHDVLAHMVLVDELRRHLLEACGTAGVNFEPNRVVSFAEEPFGLTLTFADGHRGGARLLAAADGARSRLRHAARIQTIDSHYGQSAVVATLRHERDHDGQAVQHFLPAGPIALLPLRLDDGSGRRTSLVWTESHAEAQRLAALPPAAFLAALQDRIGFGLGAATLEDVPRVHTLQLMLARSLTAPRFALLGDAARAVHPLAGQGLNLGLRDALALSRRIIERAELGLDPAGRDVLLGYERDRRFDATSMAAATDSLNRLFSNDRRPLRMIRDFGLGLVDRSPAAKRLFVDRATGAARRGRQSGP